MTTHVADTFTRTNASSWGTADTGGAWTTEANANVTYSTDGSTASRAATAQANTYVQVGGTGAGNKTVLFRFKVSNLCVGNYRDLEVELRRWGGTDDDPDCYFLYVRVGKDGATNTIAAYIDNGASTNAIGSGYDTGINCAANQWLWCKAQIEGKGPTTIRGKLWLDGENEPASWQIEQQDNTSNANLTEVSTGPHFGAIMLDNLGTPDYTTFTIDDLTVTSLDATPQPIAVHFIGSHM